MAGRTGRNRKARPRLEALEGRQLLDGGLAPELSLAQDPPPVKRINFTTPDRVRVVVNLIGVGTLEGSSVRPDGSLDLIFDGTNENSIIVGHAVGGPARLASMRDADTPIFSQSGIGSNLLGLVALNPFDLIPGGTVNLNGGVRKLKLRSAGPNAEIFLRELPEVAEERENDAGRDVSLSEAQGGRELVLTDGGFFPVFTVQAPEDPGPPPGIRIEIGRINGIGGAVPPLQQPQVYAFDAQAGRLLRFNAFSGDLLAAFDVPSLAPEAGVGLGRVGDDAVVLVGQADVVRAFDLLTAAPVGQFSTANLPGFDSINAIGQTDTTTVIIDADATNPGRAQIVDIAASLQAGQAVAVGDPFVPDREFDFLSGATGVPGFELLTALGSGFFDPFQPNMKTLGALELDTTDNQIVENDRVAAPGNILAPPPPGQEAVGSVDGLIARVVDVEGGKNVVNLVARDTVSVVDTVPFNYPTRLAGLSESFRPQLDGTVVVDVQGDVQAFLADQVQGLVLNDTGTLHLLGLGRARDSFVIGFPVNHVFIGLRDNVQILTPAPRDVGGRGGVTVVPGLRPLGPIFTPRAS